MIWPQVFADVTGYSVKIIKEDVEALLGDALLAGAEWKFLIDRNTIGLAEFEKTIRSDLANIKIYDSYFEQYRQSYLNLAKLGKSLRIK